MTISYDGRSSMHCNHTNMKKALLILSLIIVSLVSCTDKDRGCNVANVWNTEDTTFKIETDNIAINLHGACASVHSCSLMMVGGEGNFEPMTADDDTGIQEVDNVRDLCSINEIPDNGWKLCARLKEGHGYVIKHRDNDNCVYHRIFVVDMIYDEESKGIDDNNEQFPSAVILAIQLDWISN